MSESKARVGNFFEDFAVGQLLTHATPRTLTAGDVALYNGLYGPRFVVQSNWRRTSRSSLTAMPEHCSKQACQALTLSPEP